MARAAVLSAILVVTALGCGGGEQPDSPDAEVAPPVDAITYPAPRDDLVPAVGSANSLDIAAWNIENFPQESSTPRVLADLITSLGLDLISVEEIADTAAFDELCARLRQHECVLSTHTYGDGSYQKIGILYRADLMQLSGTQLLFDSAGYEFPRPPLQATITVDDGVHPSFDFVLIAVHLKAGTTTEDRTRRTDANVMLEEYVSQLITGIGDDDVVVLGDFNEVLTSSWGLEVMAPWLDSNDAYDIHTRPLADDGEESFLPSGALIDHVISTPSLADEFAGGATQIPRLDSQYNNYEYQVSDHLPVVVGMPVL